MQELLLSNLMKVLKLSNRNASSSANHYPHFKNHQCRFVQVIVAGTKAALKLLTHSQEDDIPDTHILEPYMEPIREIDFHIPPKSSQGSYH